MSDIFENAASKYRNTPSALILFIASLAMLVIGINHFAEDTYSSYLGLVSLEQAFRMNVQIFDWTYWTMSIAPQVASVVFFYIYMSNTNKKWSLWVSFISQAIDFFADVWYRSDGTVFQNGQVAVVSCLITFAYFTLGSEVFVSFGAGLCIKLFAPALHSWKYFKSEIEKVKKQFKDNQYVGSEKHSDVAKTYNPKSSIPPIQTGRDLFSGSDRKKPTYHNIGKLPFNNKK